MADAGHSGLQVLAPPNPPYQQNVIPQDQYYACDNYQGGPPLQTAKPRQICGMKSTIFWTMLVIVLSVIVGAGVGAGVGISVRRKKQDYTPYALETGPWNMNDLLYDKRVGTCRQSVKSAVSGCGKFDTPFVVIKVGSGYEIANAFLSAMNGPLGPPQSDHDMWSKNYTYSRQAGGVEAACIVQTDIKIMLGMTYQYEVSMKQFAKEACELDNNLTSTAEQRCDCYWYGFLNVSA